MLYHSHNIGYLYIIDVDPPYIQKRTLKEGKKSRAYSCSKKPRRLPPVSLLEHDSAADVLRLANIWHRALRALGAVGRGLC